MITVGTPTPKPPKRNQARNPVPKLMSNLLKLEAVNGVPLRPIQVNIANRLQERKTVMVHMMICLGRLTSFAFLRAGMARRQAIKKPPPCAAMLAGGNGLDVATIVRIPTRKAMPIFSVHRV